MKVIKSGILIILILATKVNADAQSFTNLNFESANVTGYSPNSLIPFSDGFPGWNGYFISSTATNQAPQAAYASISLAGNAICIADTNVGFGFVPIQGNYGAFLFGGIANDGTVYAAQISQSGLVPSGTKSLQLDAQTFGYPFTITLGGQTITMSPLQTFSSYTLYGGNMPSSLAGQVAMLSITEPAPTIPFPTELELDDIVFSPISIPEPGVLSLFGLGGLAFLLHRRKAKA